MKIKMYLLDQLWQAVNTMACQRVKGMNRYVYDLTTALEKELRFFAQENDAILKEYGEKDEAGNLIQDEHGSIKLPTAEGREALAELYNYETAELPEMSKEQAEKLDDEYALTREEYWILKQLVRSDDTDGNK